MKKNIFLQGLTTGLLLQLAIGPLFIFIMNITMQNGLLNGLFAVIGVTLADYLYIILAIYGVGKFLEAEKIKRTFTLISSLVLIGFGIMILLKGIQFSASEHSEAVRQSLWNSFLSTFVLTISSPLTILFWTSIFTTKALELSLSRRELVVFGISAGSATFLFLGLSSLILSGFRVMIPVIVFQILNVAVGAVLIMFGIIRISKTCRTIEQPSKRIY